MIESTKVLENLPKKDYASPELRELGTVHMTTQGTGGTGHDAIGPMTMKSDLRAKENVVRIGTHPMGFGIYLFDYKPEFSAANGKGRQFGVIADEVEDFVPEAVSIGMDGYKQVNYSQLGISSPPHLA